MKWEKFSKGKAEQQKGNHHNSSIPILGNYL
jgi:hypothetical protein